MAATKLLLLLFSVVLLGLTSAEVEDEEPLQESSLPSSESEEYLEPVPQDTLLEEQDSGENQSKKSFGKSQDKKKSGGRHGPAGPRGNDGGSGPRFPQNRQKDGGQKSEKLREPAFGRKNRSGDAKKRRGGQ